jgi:uncharacterized Zn finger protein
MGWYYEFRPYVSVAQRRQNALRELEKRRKKGLAVSPVLLSGRNIATTFWGKAWCENLESYSDFANRLPRGRTYVRNGSVVHLEILPGKIKAHVSGSDLYTVEISISPLAGHHWKCVKGQCAGQIGSLVELLKGRLSKSVMDVVTQRSGGLFPKPAEIEMKCSCPDWAGMCKHVAAVMYGVGSRLDEKPELLFVLRKVDHLELIAGVIDGTPVAQGGEPRGKKTIANEELADVFGIELAGSEHPADAPAQVATKPAKAPDKTAKPAPKPAKATSKQAAVTPRQAKVKTARAKSAKGSAAHVKVASRRRTEREPV